MQTGKIPVLREKPQLLLNFLKKQVIHNLSELGEKNGINFIQNKDFFTPEETSALHNRAGFSFGDTDWPDEKFFFQTS